MFCSLSNYAETHHEIPESVIWNWLVDLLMVSKSNLFLSIHNKLSFVFQILQQM